MDMKASVIIPAYNEEDSIESTLDSLEASDAEVIVVVDGDDSTDEIARGHSVVDKVIKGDSSGAGQARNKGVDYAHGDVVIFTDADTVVPEDWVQSHLECYTDETVIGVGGPADSLEKDFKNRILYRFFGDYMYRISWPLGLTMQPGFNCSFKKEYFLEEGGFNEEIPFMEDTELSLRMKKYGKIVYEPATRVETSARRESENGYIMVALKYFKAYMNYYILGREINDSYFDKLDK